MGIPMARLSKLWWLSWGFVFAVVGYDIGFTLYWCRRPAWMNEHQLPLFELWEVNPVARGAYWLGGLPLVLVCRVLMVLFAAWVSSHQWRGARWITWLAVLSHAALLCRLLCVRI